MCSCFCNFSPSSEATGHSQPPWPFLPASSRTVDRMGAGGVLEPSQASVCEQSNLSWGDAPGKASKCGRRGQGQQYQQRFSRLIGDWRLWRGAITDKLGGQAGFGVKVRFKSSLHMDWSNRKRHAQGRYIPLVLSCCVLFAWPLVGCSASCVYRMLRCVVCCCCCYSVLCVVRCCVALRYVALPCPALPCSLAGKDALCAATLLSSSQTAVQRKQLPYVYARPQTKVLGVQVGATIDKEKERENESVCVCVWTSEASRFAAKGNPSWC